MRSIDRRDFGRMLAGAAAGAALSSFAAVDPPAKDAPLKFSVMLWTVDKKLPFERRIEMVAEAGYSAVELVDEFKGWSDADFRRANARKRELKLTFDATAGVGKGIADPGGIDAFIADLTAFVPTAQKLECMDIIVLSGNRVEGATHEQQHQACVESLKRGADIAERNGLRLLLENIDQEENPKYFLTSVAEGFEIVREVNHPRVKFLYDFYHEQISEGNLIKKLEENIQQVGLVHIADVPGRHEPGTGEIAYASIYRKLAQLHYDGYVAMEFEPTGNVVESLRKARSDAIDAAIKSIF
jgi:hydroxypyruvate isomerase